MWNLCGVLFADVSFATDMKSSATVYLRLRDFMIKDFKRGGEALILDE
jgi:hypothetical protein